MTNIVVGLIGLAIGVALGWLIAQLRTSQPVSYTHLTLPTSDLV